MPDFVSNYLGLGFPCLFHTFTGLYCVGCGGTRALFYLLRGNVAKSFQYHPLVLYGALVGALEFISFSASVFFHRPGLYLRRYRLFASVGAVIVVINWIFKNYMLVVRGIDLLP